MNNNDILNTLHNSGEHYQPSDRLDPAFVENSLSGIKRKSNKALITSGVTLSVACLTVAAVFITQSFKNDSYGRIYKTIEAVKKENEPSLFGSLFDYMTGNYSTNEYVTLDAAEEFSYSSSSNKTGTEHSTTNVQVDGVDEADVVKTDGKYIYSINNEEIIISNPNDGKPEFVTSIETEYTISDLYIHQDKLIAIADNQEIIISTATDDSTEYIDPYGTTVIFYDISDINSPKEISTLSQSGECISTRKIGNVLYLSTIYNLNDLSKIEEETPETYCPYYITADKVRCVNADDITICDKVNSVDYVTISSIDLDNPNDFSDICSVLGGGEEIYASANNIYISSYQNIDNSYKTQILRFSIDKTEITSNGSLTVAGRILNQFSMDEYDGYFRVVTEKEGRIYTNSFTNDSATTLYVFDSNLKQVGKTDNVAKGESVKSVRFDGDIAYFVTFRQTDPLFTIDLSNPESPEILSELKIPGFSQYLHILSDDLLFGFGRDADEQTGISEGLKLSMFDTSDKTNVTEKTSKIFTSDYEYSEAEYNHKAIYVDEENYIIGIPYRSYENSNSVYYSLFKYDTTTNDFVQLMTAEEQSYNDNYFYYDSYTRGLKIGDNFYIVTSDSIYAYNYSGFEKTGSLNIK